MIRTLSFCAAVVLSLLLPLAGSASAKQAQFEWAPSTATMKGSAWTVQQFTTQAASISCNEVSGEANVSGLSGPVQTLTASAIAYGNNGSSQCDAGFWSPEIRMNGCFYKFSAGENSALYEPSTGTVSISCPQKQLIEVIAPMSACTIKIGAQNGLGSVTYTNLKNAGVPNEVMVKASLNNITYTYNGYICGTGSGTNGNYTGSTVVKGRNSSGGQTAIWVE